MSNTDVRETLRSPSAPAPGVVPASWGLILRSGSGWRVTVARLSESLLGATGVALGLVAVGLWVAPGAVRGPDVLGMKTVLTTFLAMGGVLLLRFASQGLCTEVHLDRLRGEIRVVARNRAGRLRLIDCMTFADITAAVLDPVDPAAPGGARRLVVHLRGSGERVPLASGPAASLTVVRDLIELDLQRARQAADAPISDLARLAPGLG